MTDDYWQVHVRTVLKLQELGFSYRLKDRLPLFRLWRQLLKLGRKNPKLRPAINRALQDLDLLKHMRVEGLEPKLESKDRYLLGG